MKKSRFTPLLLSLLVGVSSAGVPVFAEDVSETPTEQVATDATTNTEIATSEQDAETAENVDEASQGQSESDSEATTEPEVAPETTEEQPVEETEEVVNEAPTEETPEESQGVAEEASAETVDEELTESRLGVVVTGQGNAEGKPEVAIDNDALYEEVLNDILHQSDTSTAIANGVAETGKSSLNEDNYKIYQYLRDYFKKVANGEETATRFNIDFASLGLKTNFTAEDLGVENIIDTSTYSFTSEATTAFNAKMQEMFNITNTVTCLLQDAPYDMYWYDKTQGAGINWSYSASMNSDGTWTMSLTSLTTYFYVSAGYNADSEYLTVDTTGVEKAKTAASNAQAIVNKNVSLSDTDKLTAYKDEINALVSYDYDAAESGDFDDYGTDDPWQLIYVFDLDEDTNVVCEGYSKAFQYLCELSSFTGDVYCYNVSGAMNNGAHMWNIVRMDGTSYLVDVTNSDAGTIGQSGGLFMVGAKSGSVNEGYVIDVNGNDVTYVYSDQTIANNLESTLTLKINGEEEAPKVTENHVRFDWNYANEGFVADQTFKEGETFTLPECTYKKKGYFFIGWALDQGGLTTWLPGKEFTSLIDTANEDVTFYAIWEPYEDMTVRFDWNYANSGEMADWVGKYDDLFTFPECNYTKDGYHFIGWANTSDWDERFDLYQPGDSFYPVDKDGISSIYFAVWEADSYDYTIWFDWNYAESGEMTPITSNNKTETFAPECGYVKPGYVCTGWNTAIDGSGKSYVIGDIIETPARGEDLLLYAQWEMDCPVDIVFDWNYANEGSVAGYHVGIEQPIVMPENGFVRYGYHFIGWSESENYDAERDTLYQPGDIQQATYTDDGGVIRTTRFYAVWESDETATVSFDWNYANSGEMSNITATVGTTITMPKCSFAKDGYHFENWNTEMDGTGEPYEAGEEVKLSKDLHLYAVWEANK